ncbi:hypothetical protein SAMN06295910_1945 [Allosphingosinicella indica]|uniref:Alginate export domain-containing protein n=2 Tax=Allosphingosinicella indica TaxID=941907 RepID=A0A1X7GJS1_9SPHN|nr:hypothetical protein [Allosphingosinicella indica]SMF70770.1 hypothetical protein SAMN06295910_1945 [Allosphingosinicella indica]
MMQLSAPLLQLAAASLGGVHMDTATLVTTEAPVAPADAQVAETPPPVGSAAPEAVAPEQLELFAPVQLAQAEVPPVTEPTAVEAGPPAPDWTKQPEYNPTPGGPNADDPLLEGRRVPGYQEVLPDAQTQNNIGAVRAPPPEAFPTDHIPIPDRWRLIQTLGVVKEKWWDPYNQNTLKGDRPLCLPTDEEQAKRRAEGIKPCATPKFLGLKTDEWFFVASAVSDSVFEPRSFPIPVGIQFPNRPGSNDVFGRNDSIVLAQTFIASAALIKGSTAYKPPDVEWRLTLAYNMNYVDVPEKRVLFIEPTKGTTRFDSFLGVQEAFLDYHFKNTSDRFDFYSGRVGIQPLQLDFRGFLFNDQQLAWRLFGNRDNNRFQYNLIGIWRLEKDTNSGLNDITQTPRQDWVLHANVYRQDFPIVGLTSEASVTWNINRERGDVQVDDNGFPVRPALIGNLRARNYDIVYLGYGVDGRVGRVNLSAQAYAALGSDRNNVFTGRKAEVRSFFFAAEPSYDVNWARFRGSFLFASGDGDPFDDTERGFDAIFENPIFAGADTSYWIRQTIPFIGGGRAISINGRNGVLNTLRSSKEEGQSNFANPGTILAGVGADFDITPEFRVSANLNHLWFHKTQVLQTLRSEGSIPKDIGWDASVATIYRPSFIQNVVFRASAAVLQPGSGFRDLFENRDRDKRYYSVLFNAILTY